MRPAGPGAASAPAALPLCRSFLPLLARAIPTPGLVSSCCWPRARRPAPEEPRAGGARAEPVGRGHWASLGLFSAAGQAGGAGGRGKGPSGSQRGPSGLVLRSLSSCPNVSEGQRPNAAPNVCPRARAGGLPGGGAASPGGARSPHLPTWEEGSVGVTPGHSLGGGATPSSLLALVCPFPKGCSVPVGALSPPPAAFVLGV